MLELDQDEVNEVSGGKILKFSAYLTAATDFFKGFVEGVKAGYNA